MQCKALVLFAAVCVSGRRMPVVICAFGRWAVPTNKIIALFCIQFLVAARYAPDFFLFVSLCVSLCACVFLSNLSGHLNTRLYFGRYDVNGVRLISGDKGCFLLLRYNVSIPASADGGETRLRNIARRTGRCWVWPKG